MTKRKYSKCVQCGRTIDVTNQDIDLCVQHGGESIDRRSLSWARVEDLERMARR
ncbi:MAG: hypothetical protein ACFFDT_21480 [Candidatus Hodarchaeota archaeon]